MENVTLTQAIQSTVVAKSKKLDAKECKQIALAVYTYLTQLSEPTEGMLDIDADPDDSEAIRVEKIAI